jgi:hypothetical protein
MRARTLAAVFAILCSVAPASSQAACTLWRATTPQPVSELAVPRGYIEICSEDAALCHTLTSGFPPSVQTFGYFVPEDEWAAFREGRTQGFRHYLIAQLATRTQPADFPALRAGLRARQGDIPDHSEVPTMVESIGRAQLGVFDETDASISFGVVMGMHLAGTPESDPPLLTVATNSVVVAGEQVLALYAYRPYDAPPDVEAAKEFTRAWVRCIAAEA